MRPSGYILPDEDPVIIEAWRNADERMQERQRLAPDHALLLAALVSGRVTIQNRHPEKLRCEVVIGARVLWCSLDLFGCPVLTPELRAELLKRAGEEPGG